MNDTPHEPERDADLLRLFQQTDATPGGSDFVHQVTRRLHRRRRHVVSFVAATMGLLLFMALRLGPAGDTLLAAADQFVVHDRMPTGWGVAAFMLITVVVVSVVSVVTRSGSIFSR